MWNYRYSNSYAMILFFGGLSYNIFHQFNKLKNIHRRDIFSLFDYDIHIVYFRQVLVLGQFDFLNHCDL